MRHEQGKRIMKNRAFAVVKDERCFPSVELASILGASCLAPKDAVLTDAPDTWSHRVRKVFRRPCHNFRHADEQHVKKYRIDASRLSRTMRIAVSFYRRR